jgi:hypothetical protein
MLRFIMLGALVIVPGLAACSAATDAPTPAGEVAGSRISEDALKGGCRVICPKCHPNQICPKYACRIECPPKTTPCGDTVCTGGQVCCNASCGICTAPDMFCTQQACEPTSGCTSIALCVEGYTWDDKKCACVPVDTCLSTGLCIEGFTWSTEACACVPSEPIEPAPACTTDSDCRKEDNYCGGCHCLALASGETGPTCKDPVQCFAQPCAVTPGEPACVKGQCTLVDEPVVKEPNPCQVGGCSGQLCYDPATGSGISTCEWREEYACYRSATCESQADGSCGWTMTPELKACLGGR